MLKKIFSTTSAMGVALVMTSSWVGQAQAFVYFDQVTYVKGSPSEYRFDYTCSSLANTFSSLGYGHAQAYEAWSGCGADDTRFKASTMTTSTAALRSATEQVTGLISGRLQAVRQPGARGYMAANHIFGHGLSAGSGGNGQQHDSNGVGVWFNAAWSNPKDDLTSTAYQGDVVTSMLGVDYEVASDLRLGLGLGYEWSHFSTTANNGSSRGRGVTVVPYATYAMGDMSFDIQAGYSSIDYDLSRKDPSAITFVETYKGDTDGTRYFAALNMNMPYSMDKWRFDTKAGVLYAREKQDSFTDTSNFNSKNHIVVLGRANLGVDVTYDMGWHDMEPYIGANALYDFQQTDVKANKRGGELSNGAVVLGAQAQPKNSEFGVLYSAGMRFDIDKNIDAVVQYSTEEHRSDYDRHIFMFNVNAGF